MWKVKWIGMSVGVWACLGAAWVSSAAPAGVRQRDELICRLPEGVGVEDVAVSPDAAHYACAAPSAGCFVAAVDGKEGKAFDWIIHKQVFFSPDGRRVAYQARRGGKVLTVIDAAMGAAYDACDPPRFSPDGGHVAYVARKGERFVAVLDGKEVGKDYPNVLFGALSPAGRLACIAAVAGKQCLLIDGVEGDLYEQVRDVCMSLDGKRIACRALLRGKWSVVVDGVEGPRYAAVEAPRFSEDGRHVGYIAAPAVPAGSDAERMLIIDGRETSVRGPLLAGPVFSPDGQRVACVMARPEDKSAVVVDGAEGTAYQGIGAIRFSRDGRRIAYLAQRGGRGTVVVDGREIGPYESILPESLSFSPDGRHVAWIARGGESEMIVVDGQSAAPFTRILPAGPVHFGSDGTISAIAVHQEMREKREAGRTVNVPLRELLRLRVTVAQ